MGGSPKSSNPDTEQKEGFTFELMHSDHFVTIEVTFELETTNPVGFDDYPLSV